MYLLGSRRIPWYWIFWCPAAIGECWCQFHLCLSLIFVAGNGYFLACGIPWLRSGSVVSGPPCNSDRRAPSRRPRRTWPARWAAPAVANRRRCCGASAHHRRADSVARGWRGPPAGCCAGDCVPNAPVPWVASPLRRRAPAVTCTRRCRVQVVRVSGMFAARVEKGWRNRPMCYNRGLPERWMSGLSRTPGKRV